MKTAQVFSGRKYVLFPACAVLTVLGAIIAGGIPAGALAQGNPGGSAACDLHTLRGSYIFAATGYNIVGGVPQPKAIVEEIVFHGDGTLTVPAVTVSVNGTVSSGAGGEGVYTLDADCTGTVTFIPGPSFDLFVERPGKQGWMIQTNPNTVFQGTVTRVSP